MYVFIYLTFLNINIIKITHLEKFIQMYYLLLQMSIILIIIIVSI